jgi:hypothetical protein
MSIQEQPHARFRWWKQAGQEPFQLLRPRPGLPAIAGAEPFMVESIESAAAAHTFHLESREGVRCPLDVIAETHVETEAGGTMRRMLLPRGASRPGIYDLVVGSDGVRAACAVCLRSPDRAATVNVAQVTDLHVGSGSRASERLAGLLADVNRARPDVVLVTGDVVNNGDRAELFEAARDTLATLDAPTFVVPGNHDHGFGIGALTTRVGTGWHHFAHAFHAYTHFEFDLGHWTFVGFDSGPSRLSPLVRTRGLDRDDLAVIARALDRAHDRGRRGVVFFSHAPSRARLTGTRRSRIAGPFARMSRGSRAFESLLRAAAHRGQRVLHVFGHTHWTDVFELDAEHRRFVRWERARLAAGPQRIDGRVALVNTPSASHATVPIRRGDRGHGFTLLELRDEAVLLDVRRYPKI